MNENITASAEETDLSINSTTALTTNPTADLAEGADIAVSPDEELVKQVFNLRPIITYKITDFEGPLDLLLQLIKDSKIRIEDIFISEVTHQYVEIVSNTSREDLDFDYAGEFIVLAANLIYLKSARAVYVPDDEPEEDDIEMRRQDLINKIKEYALMKEQAEKLKQLETVNRFYRLPMFTEKDYRVSLVNFSLPKLVDAFARVLVNAERKGKEVIPKKVMHDRFSVADMMQKIRELILLYEKMTFTSLIEPDFDRNDIVTTFLAVLELLKYGKLKATQDELFAEIYLFKVEDGAESPIEFEEEGDGKY